MPDLTNVHMRWMYDVANAGGLADVTDFINEIGIESFASGALEGTKINGKYYGVPYRSSGMGFYWNKNIFRAAGLDPEIPPKTWDEVLEFSKIIKEKTGKPGFALDSKTNDGAFNNIITLVNSFGGQVIDKEKMVCTLDEPAGIKAAQFIYELNKSGANIAGAVGLSNDDARQLFNQGQVGMNYEGPWATADLRLAGQVYGVDYGVTFMPSGDPNKIGYSPLIGWALTYPSWLEPEKAKNVQKLIKFILEPVNMEWFMADWGTSYQSPSVPGTGNPKYTEITENQHLGHLQSIFSLRSINVVPGTGCTRTGCTKHTELKSAPACILSFHRRGRAALAGFGLRTARGARNEEPKSHQARRGIHSPSHSPPPPTRSIEFCKHPQRTWS